MSYKYKFKPHRKKTIGKREFPVKNSTYSLFCSDSCCLHLASHVMDPLAFRAISSDANLIAWRNTR